MTQVFFKKPYFFLNWMNLKFFLNFFYLRRSRQVIERWELLLLLLLLLGEDYFEVMTSEVGQRSRSTFLDVQYPLHVPPKIFFRVGSVAIDQDLLLLDQISLRGGIRHSFTRFLFGVGSVTPYQISLQGGISSIYTYTMVFVRAKNILSMPQVFEQSLFLFEYEAWGEGLRWKEGKIFKCGIHEGA